MAKTPEYCSTLRLHDLCSADKQKLGELLQVFSTEKRKSRERIVRLESDRKAYKRVICELAKENHVLSAETVELQQELQEVLGKLREIEDSRRGKSALSEVKSLKSEVTELSLSLKQLSTGSETGRKALEALEGNESKREWCNTRRNPLLLLETGRYERSRGGETERDQGNRPIAGLCAASITYEDSLWDLLDSIECERIPTSRLPNAH